MRAARLLSILTGMVIWTSRVLGEIQPSFHLDPCAWNATAIVVVTEGEAIDGKVDVLESWKGNLRRGEQITLAELAGFAPEASRSIAKGWHRNDETVPAFVTCSRMILFLGGAKDMKVSMAWVEDDDVFVFSQQMNPGPSELRSSGMSELQVKQVVDDIVVAQRRLTEAIQSDDATRLESIAPSLLRVESAYVRRFILEALGAAGESAVPALRQVLHDESFLDHHADAIAAIGKAGGSDAAPEITRLLEQELTFWQRVGPRSSQGWWNGEGVEADELNRLRSHYGRTYAALTALKGMHFVGSREVVTRLRTLWRSHQALRDVGNDQIGEECDELLAAVTSRWHLASSKAPPNPSTEGRRLLRCDSLCVLFPMAPATIRIWMSSATRCSKCSIPRTRSISATGSSSNASLRNRSAIEIF
jgi:hypothetical protein